jgi:Nuclease-related domain
MTGESPRTRRRHSSTRWPPRTQSLRAPLRDLFYPARSGAGAGANERFQKLSRRWRRRVLRMPRRVVILLGVPLLVGEILDRHLMSWGLGLCIGALVAVWTWVSDSPPPHIENWRTGARGERRTAKALAPLRRHGWILFHDLPNDHPAGRRGNIDHVVVGPSGVFLLDSKWFGGDASVEGDQVLVQRKDDEENSYALDGLARSVRGKAVSLQQDLAYAGVAWVQGVVVFWNDF